MPYHTFRITINFLNPNIFRHLRAFLKPLVLFAPGTLSAFSANPIKRSVRTNNRIAAFPAPPNRNAGIVSGAPTMPAALYTITDKRFICTKCRVSAF
jgi:hypothetical protein